MAKILKFTEDVNSELKILLQEIVETLGTDTI